MCIAAQGSEMDQVNNDNELGDEALEHDYSFSS